MNRIKILGCCIAKNENNYIREWLDWHYNLGFSKIIIYDNNDDESLLQIIQDYIKNNLVIIKNYRGLKAAQSKAYIDCYKNYNNSYDYIMFFDCDEFLLIDKKYKNILEILLQQKFLNIDIIRLCWKVYGDNGLTTVQNSNFLVLLRFLTPSTYTFYNRYYKSLIRCKNNKIKNISAHGCYNIGNIAVYTNGKKCENIRASEIYSIYDDIWINHYHTKTITEFIQLKLNRGDASNLITANNTTLDFFFKINAYTQEKLKIINTLCIM